MKLVAVPKFIVPTVNGNSVTLQKKGKKKKNKKSNSGQAVAGAIPSYMKMSGKRVNVTNPLLGGRNITSSSGSLPACFVDILGNSTFISSPSAVMHPELGIQGVNLHGCQPLAGIQQVTGAAGVFVANSLATQIDQSSIYLSPDTLNGPLAAQANMHSKYVFRDILIEYISSCPTTTPSCMCLGFSEGGSDADATDFATGRQIVPSVTFPFRADRAYLHYSYTGPQLFKTLTTAGTTAVVNEFSNQGVIGGWGDGAAVITGTGFTNIYYSIDLYGPMQTQGFTMGFDSREERFIFQSILNQLRGGVITLKSLLNHFGVDMSQMPRVTAPRRAKDSLNYSNDLKALTACVRGLPELSGKSSSSSSSSTSLDGPTHDFEMVSRDIIKNRK